MKILHLVCKMCGAPMEVTLRRAGRAMELECEFCGSTALVRDEGEREPTTEADTNASGGTPSESVFKNPELVLLDSQWRRERRRFERVDERGRRHAPSPEATMMILFFALIAAIGGLADALASGPGPVTFFLLFLAAGFAFAGISNGKRARAYAVARKRYRRKRRDLMEAVKTGATDS